jgi:RHS repeat-associated protein
MGFYLQLHQERICLFSEGGNRAVEKEVTENRVQISGYRYYSPRLGRWITRDPIGEDGGFGLYVCVSNDPIGYIDPFGMQRRNWRDPNFWRGWNLSFFDERGKEILGRWLNGEDTEVTFDGDNWARYMKANDRLTEQLKDRIEADALIRENSGVVDITFWAEIQNGYFTGYQMLHATNPDVGNFQIRGYASFAHMGGGSFMLDAAKIEYHLTLTWNDIIDPNPKYPGDIVASWILRLFYDPQDYIVHIVWNADPIITRCKDEVRLTEGYPFE